MLILKQKVIIERRVIYDYFPEDKSDYRTIELNLDTGELKLVKKTEIYTQSIYLMHDYQALMRMRDEEDFSKYRIVAWY